MIDDLPAELTAHDDRDVWGMSPESIALAVNAQVTGTTAASAALDRYYDLAVLVTNYDPGREVFRDSLETIVEAWFDESTMRAAAHISADSVAAFVAGAAYFDTPSGIANVLVQGQEALDQRTDSEPLVLSRPDYLGYVESETERALLRSLRVATPVVDGFQLNDDLLETLAYGFGQSRSAAAHAIVDHVLTTHGVADTTELVPEILEACGVTPPETTPDAPAGALSVLIRNNALTGLVDTLFGADFETVLVELATETTRRREQLQRALVLGTPREESPTAVSWPIAAGPATVCALSSQQDVPVAAGWITTQEEMTELTVHDELRSAGLEVAYDDGLFEFDAGYELPTDPPQSVVDDYNAWVSARLETLQARGEALASVRNDATDHWARQRQRLLTAALTKFEEFTVSPTRFIYTIFDPEYHADAYTIERYVGDSQELEAEVDKIQQWRQSRPDDAESFAEMIPEVINYPLEGDDVEPIVRIMCPWTNFAVQDYVSQFSRLFDNDVTVQLLFRLPSRNKWVNMRNNLLSRLGDTAGNLEIRSYTRYKTYHDHPELSEIKDDENRQLSEMGVHAKLFVAGASDDGNLLVGSANLMENSFYYNPEAGIQTRNPHIIDTAIDYFDLIWEVSAPDRIPDEAFTGEMEYSFHPAVYRPQ